MLVLNAFVTTALVVVLAVLSVLAGLVTASFAPTVGFRVPVRLAPSCHGRSLGRAAGQTTLIAAR